MTRLRGFRLTVSMWPFLLIAPGELLFYSLYRIDRFSDEPPLWAVASTALLVGSSLAAEWLCLLVWRGLVGHRRWARGPDAGSKRKVSMVQERRGLRGATRARKAPAA